MINILGIYVEITTECNLRCIHCYNDSGKKQFLISKDNLVDILDYAKEINLMHISLSGGEPLMHPQILDFLNIITTRYNMIVTLVTNAILVTQKMIDDIKLYCNTDNIRFQISIDGSTKQEHEYIRGKGSYEPLIEAINILSKNNIPFYFHSLIHIQNYKNLDGLIAIACDYNAERQEFYFLKKKGRGDKNYDRISIPVSEQLKLIDYLDAQKKNEYIGISAPVTFFGICPFVTDDNDFDLSLRVDACGNVFPCQNIGQMELSIGNINDESLVRMTSVEKMIEIRDKIKEILNSTKKCEKCFVSYNCSRGCPGVECLNNFEGYSDDCLQRRSIYGSTISNFIKNCSITDKHDDTIAIT